MKFTGLKQFLTSPSTPDDEPPPPVQRRKHLELSSLRQRLQLANAQSPDEFTPMADSAMQLVERYLRAQDPTEKLAVLGHLFFTTQASMIRMERRPLNPTIPMRAPVRRDRSGATIGVTPGLKEVRRRQVLRELYAVVAGKLADCFDTTVNVLPRYLEERFGTELTSHGVHMDPELVRNALDRNVTGYAPKLAYLEDLDRSRYRVVMRYGRAYGLTGTRDAAEEAPLDTTQSELRSYHGKHRRYAWGFVLGMSRELYVANHSLATRDLGCDHFFHSSYFAGGNVLSAGDIVIRDGMVHSITNLSGHYKPAPATLVHVLEYLKTHGADLSQVLVGAFDGETGRGDAMKEWSDDDAFRSDAMSAGAFLASQRDWSHLRTERPRRRSLHEFQQMKGNGWRPT